MTRIRFKILLFILHFMALGNAMAAVDQTELLEAKAKIEDAITKKYQNRISTRIRNELFSVGTQVSLVVKKELVDASELAPTAAPNRRNPSQYFSDLPADISLGILASPAANSNEEATAAAEPAPKVLKDKIKITRVLVHVGLSPKLGQAYQEQFKTWLIDNIKAEFGNLGQASVNNYIEVEPTEADNKKFELKMDPKSIVITANESKTPRVLGWEERFGQFQNFIGLFLLAVIMMITFIIGKYLPSKDVANQLAMAERMHELKNSNSESGLVALPGPKAKASNELETTGDTASFSQAATAMTFESFQDLQRKVAFLVLSSKENMHQVTQIWLDEGEMGRGKIALVLDCVLTNLGKIDLTQMGKKEAPLEWSIPESIKNDKTLAQVFQTVANLDLSAKYEVLEKAYWNLLSIQTVGANLTKRRFAAIAQLPAAEIHKIMNTQDEKVKSLTYLHLPPEKLKQVLATLPIDDKKSIMDQAFSNLNLSESDLDQVNSTLNSALQENLKSVQAVNLQRLAPNLLAVMTPLEEIQIISHFVAAHPESVLYLKQNYPSFYFLNEWPLNLLKLTLGQVRNTQLLALVQAMPELKDIVLGALPGRSQAMLKNDIGVKILTTDELNLNLAEIRSQLLTMHEQSELNLNEIFNDPARSTTNIAA